MASTVALDVRMWDHPGIGRYIRELSLALIEQENAPAFRFIGGRNARKILTSKPTFYRHSFVLANSRIYGLGEQWEIAKKSLSSGLLHVPHFNVPVLSPQKLVVTIHDLIYLREPGASRSRFAAAYTAFLMKHISKKARAIIAVSEATKKELLEYFPGISEGRIQVIHEAASRVFQRMHDPKDLLGVRDSHSLHAPFILCVGSLRPHKNIVRLIEAVGQLRKQHRLPHELVIVGKANAHSDDILAAIRHNGFVRYLGELPDKELAFLYNLTDLFVLPSLKEGFGLPLVEAMACGAPVAASNRSSLPEVVGDAGVLFDPERVDALSEALYNVLKDTELQKKMSSKSLARAATFSWEHTAAETLKIYRKVLEGRAG